MTRYEYTNRLPSTVYGGFIVRPEETTIITMMGYFATRNEQEGSFHLYSILFPPKPIPRSIPTGRSIENTKGLCTLSDLTDLEFKTLSKDYPNDELQELKALESEYKNTVIQQEQKHLEELNRKHLSQPELSYVSEK